MSNKRSITFEQRIPKTPTLTILKQPYRAYDIDASDHKTSRIRIGHWNQDRMSSSFDRAYLVEVTIAPDSHLTLVFLTSFFMIEGKNLADLFEKLDANQVNTVRCFDPLIHIPLDNGEPIITSIERTEFQGEENTAT